jgi:hypothetical protein
MRIIVGELVVESSRYGSDTSRQTWEILSDGGMRATVKSHHNSWGGTFELHIRGLDSPAVANARSLYEAIRWYREVVGDDSPLVIESP